MTARGWGKGGSAKGEIWVVVESFWVLTVVASGAYVFVETCRILKRVIFTIYKLYLNFKK